MKIASFDIGIKNMAYCIFVRTPKQGGTTCVGVQGITEEDLSSKVIVRTPERGTSVGVRGLSGEDLSSTDNDISPSPVRYWRVVDWNVVDLMDTSVVIIQKPVCGCLLKIAKRKGKNDSSMNKTCGKKAKYLKSTVESSGETTTNYFCEKHAKNETQYLLPSKEYTLAHLRKQKVDGIVELYERFCLSGIPEKKYPNKPEMIDSIMKYYTSRLFSEIPIAKKNANDANLIQIGWAIRRIFDSSPHFSNITHVVIENQISPIASRMKTIQGMLAQYFIMKSTLEQPVEIVFVSSSNKLRFGEPIIKPTNQKTPQNQSKKIDENETPKEFPENQLITETPPPLSTNANYKQHKKDGVALCSRFIESNIELSNWSNVMKENTKKDDLADCFLQGIWFLSNRNIITCAENLKINIV